MRNRRWVRIALAITLPLALAGSLFIVQQNTAQAASKSDPFLREVQSRLLMAGVNPGPLDGLPGPKTTAAIKHFQGKYLLPPTGVADKARTYKTLKSVTAFGAGVLKECYQPGKIVCVNKSMKLARVFENGKQLYVLDARLARRGYETLSGHFWVSRKAAGVKNPDGTWKIDPYNHKTRSGAPMPYGVYYNFRGEGLHYSPFFARDGYNGGSLGCVNLRDKAAAEFIWNWAEVDRTKVTVYNAPSEDLAAADLRYQKLWKEYIGK